MKLRTFKEMKKEKKEKLITFLLFSFVIFLFFWNVNLFKRNGNILATENYQKAEVASIKADNYLLKELKEKREEKKIISNLKKVKLKARSAIAVYFSPDGEEKILLAKDQFSRLPIASLTKLMTSLVVFDLKSVYHPSKIIKISKEAVDQDGDSKWGGLKIGEEMTVNALLHMALIESNNDAAFALTEPLGEESFVDLMNLYAKKIGLKNTHFYNPNGLEPDDPQSPLINNSTVIDLAEFAEYIFNNYPQIFDITRKQSYPVLRPNGEIHHFIPENTNKLLKEFSEVIIGGKTGWSPRANGCLLIVLKDKKRNGHFINVVLGSSDRFGDMRKIIKAEINN